MFELHSEMTRFDRARTNWIWIAHEIVRSHFNRMPKENRRKTSKEAGLSGAGINEGSRLERKASRKSSEICDELVQKAEEVVPSSAFHSNSTGAQTMMEVRRVPQVTITPEGGGSSREMKQEDWDDVVDGPLRRKLSNSSISSTGSSLVESEDDLLSDNETKTKGIITLEHLAETAEVSSWGKQLLMNNLVIETWDRYIGTAWSIQKYQA